LPVLANLQSKLGLSVNSTATWKRLAELRPLSAQAHIELGIALTAVYSYQAALEEFSKAALLGPNPALARLYKGRTLYDLGRIGEARQELQASCALSPKVAGCWYLFALVEQQAKNIPLSIKYLGDVLRLEPQNADAEFLLGQSWFELGKLENAIEHWKAALQAYPDQWRSLYSLAQNFESYRGADAQKYRVRLQEVKQSHHVSDRIGLLSQLAEEAAAAREWPAVIARYQEALRECGYCNSAVELHKALGITYCQVGRLASGEHELRIALQLRPDDTRTSQTLELLRAAGEGTHKE
jgi:superkiller protein 3